MLGGLHCDKLLGAPQKTFGAGNECSTPSTQGQKYTQRIIDLVL